MPSGRLDKGALGEYLRRCRLGERGTAALFNILRAAGSIPRKVRRIRGAGYKLAFWVACPIVALGGEAVRYARIHRRSLGFVALLCATLMSDGEMPISPPGSPGLTRVMIVDDHPVLRRGLRALLLSYPDFEVVGEAGSGEEAIRLFEQVRPDIILMDLVMPGMGGVAAIRAIRAIAPDAKIMVVSTYYEEGDLVQEAFQAGAIGYQVKGVEIDDLVNAIRQAVSGIPSLAPAAAQSLVRITTTTTTTGRKLGDDLTEREREVLTLLARGLSNTAIADRMVVTVATVKFHLRSVRSKLGTKTRTETVAVALQNRLIDLT